MSSSRRWLLLLLLVLAAATDASGAKVVAALPETAGQVQQEESCGHWQQQYAKLHAQMLRGDLPERWAVASGHNGLAGRSCLLLTADSKRIQGRKTNQDKPEAYISDKTRQKPTLCVSCNMPQTS
jgi:hypothetical protein